MADLNKNLEKLDKLLGLGKITQEEHKKAKSILQKMEKVSSQKNEIKKTLRINTYKDSRDNYEKKELFFGDYRIYTHRPGGIKIRRLSDNKQLAVISDKFSVKYYNGGEDFFNVKIDKKELKISLNFQGVELLKWDGKYVKKHNANFFRIITATNESFHYYIYINLKGGKSIAVNLKKFDKKIDKAVAKAKVRLASKHGITLEQIEYILKRREDKKNKELEKIIGREIDSEIEANLEGELTKTIGDELGRQFDSIIIDGMEQEFSDAVNDAIAEAVSMGVDEATARAALEAMLAVYAAGGTDADALAACQAVAGDSC